MSDYDYDSETDSFIERKKETRPTVGARELIEIGRLQAEIDELKKQVAEKSKTTTTKEKSKGVEASNDDEAFIFVSEN